MHYLTFIDIETHLPSFFQLILFCKIFLEYLTICESVVYPRQTCRFYCALHSPGHLWTQPALACGQSWRQSHRSVLPNPSRDLQYTTVTLACIPPLHFDGHIVPLTLFSSYHGCLQGTPCHTINVPLGPSHFLFTFHFLCVWVFILSSFGNRFPFLKKCFSVL